MHDAVPVDENGSEVLVQADGGLDGGDQDEDGIYIGGEGEDADEQAPGGQQLRLMLTPVRINTIPEFHRLN